MSAPNEIVKTNRQVIEHKLLTALAEGNSVAILCSKQDLEDLIAALESFRSPPAERLKRIEDLSAGLAQLLKEAFSQK